MPHSVYLSPIYWFHVKVWAVFCGTSRLVSRKIYEQSQKSWSERLPGPYTRDRWTLLLDREIDIRVYAPIIRRHGRHGNWTQTRVGNRSNTSRTAGVVFYPHRDTLAFSFMILPNEAVVTCKLQEAQLPLRNSLKQGISNSLLCS